MAFHGFMALAVHATVVVAMHAAVAFVMAAVMVLAVGRQAQHRGEGEGNGCRESALVHEFS
jgi:hypothetical protein